MPSLNRRGGKHAVKDQDLTHTKYDDYNREQLLAAVKEAGCYVKDDKKSVMARKLAEHDRNKQYEARRALQERKEKEDLRQQEIANAAQAQRDRRAARGKRNEERSTRYEQGEEVSSNFDDTDEDQDRCDAHKLTVTGGLALSDETWEDSCSDTTIRSENPPVRPACRLQLLEWPYTNPPRSSPHCNLQPALHPAPLPYAPLKLVTTITNEKVNLPGQNYPAGVDPEYVPSLDALTRSAARHGHLLNQLSHAVIEPASLWAARTTVQAWNGMMYFTLPAPSLHDTKSSRLDDVYRKWHTSHSKLPHPTPSASDVKSDRRARMKQIATLKRRRVAEVYEASLWKPTAVGYLPAYLDWSPDPSLSCVPDMSKTLERLWYIRFPGCDVPHYFFWSCLDASTPDPGWSIASFAFSKNSYGEKVRVKRLTSPPLLYPPPQPISFEDTIESIERHLVSTGLKATLAHFCKQAETAGKAHAWTKTFSEPLVRRFPSGAVARAPPVSPERGACVAGKMAALLDGQDVDCFTGGEGWTRDDDEFWEVMPDAGREDHNGLLVARDELETVSDPDERVDGQALYRRDSFEVLPLRASSAEDGDKRVWIWLAGIASTYPPLSTPLSSDIIGIDGETPPLNLNGPETTPTCPFCSHDWSKAPEWEKAAHMLSHSHISTRPQTSTCREDAMGKGVKRRHSVLSHHTLQIYNRKYGRGRRTVRVDFARSLAGSLAESIVESVREGVVERLVLEVQKAQRERSPYSKERQRARTMKGLQIGCGQGRGGRGWMLERAQSELGLGDWMDEMAMDKEVDECDGESVWLGDDEM
ncbi:hypothetical protein E8E11_002432 [Didymella keratinophila]|nr:hypothetical protein E8E11_002432 [Didymella keratinophila]